MPLASLKGGFWFFVPLYYWFPWSLADFLNGVTFGGICGPWPLGTYDASCLVFVFILITAFHALSPRKFGGFKAKCCKVYSVV
ncbi:uncharacterized protein EI90DRAFT_3080699 [Cantharellus anzutake]|uniref:uncharacterized protein n=1 Tax=Cantharellus anzutake TaxID=1750568 RepID=UPI0019065EE2|nr:uncharacterized protein EI90DRAFT_3080699 [Cantharellus anzutake]KAF8320582.1 hypothetical protein EI90DRAFT_3080699 [Cantharellus anzutake]